MTDRRGQTEQEQTDFGAFYAGPVGLPAAVTPQDMPTPPQPSLSEMFSAGADQQDARNTNWEQDRAKEAYEPIIRSINADFDPRFGRPRSRGLLGIQGSVFENPGYSGRSRRDHDSDEPFIWAYIAARRKIDPGYLPDAPKSKDELYVRIRKAEQEKRGAAARVSSANTTWSGWAAGFAGGAYQSFDDPAVLMTLPVGGFGRNLATRLGTEIVAQMGVQAALEPATVKNLTELGEKVTPGQIATDILAAGAAGAVFHLGISEPLGAIIGRIKAGIPDGARTDVEQGVLDVLTREGEADALSPFEPGLGAEVHTARLNGAMDSVAANLPSAPPSPRANLRSGTSLGSGTVAPPTIPRVDVTSAQARQTFKGRVRGAESSGNDLAAASTSSAFGRYQFTVGTWQRYYIRRYGRGGLSDAQIAAKRADPSLQEQLMDDLTADNARALLRIGARETAGNLYLMHFAGEGGGTAILRAAPDTPIERILTAEAINANSFLRGKTAGDVVRWAHRKMGEDAGSAPLIRRDVFPEGDEGDAAWREAQHASDLAELEYQRVSRENMEAGYLAEPGERRALLAEREAEVPLDMGPPDRSFADEPDFVSGYLADAGERQAARVELDEIDPDIEPVMRDWDAEDAAPAAATERQTYSVETEPAANPQRGQPPVRPTRTIYLSQRGAEHLSSARERGASIELDDANNRMLVETDRGIEEIPYDREAGDDAQPVYLTANNRITELPRAARPARPSPGHAFVRALDDGQRLARENVIPIANDAASSGSMNATAQAIGSNFSDPVGAAARSMADGLTHDINQALDTGELGNIAFAVDEQGHSARVVLADLDADDAALAAIEACL